MTTPERQPDIAIRLAAIDEAAVIAAVLARAFAEYRPLYTAAGFAATTPTPEQIRARWREGPVWVATRGSDVVGTVAAVPTGDALYVRSMAVLPEARGQAIARSLLRAVERFAVANGARRLQLSTTPFLDRAIRLYEQAGFHATGTADLFGTPLITMEKPI